METTTTISNEFNAIIEEHMIIAEELKHFWEKDSDNINEIRSHLEEVFCRHVTEDKWDIYKHDHNIIEHCPSPYYQKTDNKDT